jgi:hypothetical protein
MCVVDFWLDSIVAGFIIEFLKGPRDGYIKSFYAAIKMLFYNNGVMTME